MKNFLQLSIYLVIVFLFFEVNTIAQTGTRSEVIIGTETTPRSNTPIYPWYGYSFTQTLYFQSEINIAGQTINQIGYQYAGTSASMEVEIEVWLSHTDLTEINTSIPLTDFTKVYDGSWICSAGDEFSVIPITPFIYNNVDNLIITVIEKKPGYNSSSDNFLGTSSGTQNLCLGAWNDGSAYDPNALPAGSTIAYRANTKLFTDDVPVGPAVSEITPLLLEFGTIELGQSNVMSVQVKNTGADPLEITGFTSSDDQFQLINTSFPIILQAAGTQNVEIQFTPTATGSADATITFLMDAGIEGDQEVQVSGDCIYIEKVIVGTGTEADSHTPIYPYYGYSYTQTIYFQSEIDAQNPAISKIAYQYTSTSPSVEVEIEVWLAHTALTELTSSVALTGSTKVYDGLWTCINGDEWTNIDIDPFLYNNTDNLLVTVIEKKPGWNSSNDAFFATPVDAGQSLCVGDWNDGSPYDPNALSTGMGINYRANILFGFEGIPTGPAVSEITPLVLDFGEVVVNYPSVQNITIKNAGSDPMEVLGASTSNNTFSLLNTSFPFTLSAYQEQTIEVEFNPLTTTSQSGTITFDIDPSIAGDREVQVSGIGVPLEFIQVGEGNHSSTYYPICAWFKYSYSQTLYFQSELNFENLAITQLGYQYARSNGSADVEIEVWMEHTQADEITSTLPLTNATKVYDGPWSVSSDDDISTIGIIPFAYNNTDNLVITVIEKDPAAGSIYDKFLTTQYPSDVQWSVVEFNTSTPYDPDNLPTGTDYGARPNTTFWVGDIPSGPAISQITPSVLDFGELEFGESSILSVEIKNVGVDPLEINGFSTTNEQYQVINTNFPIVLPTSQQQTVEIQFLPTSTEFESGTISFDMDAGIEGDKEVEVSGQMLPVPPVVITDFPYVEGFDGGALPEGWQNIVNAGEGWNFFTSPFSHTVTYYFGDLERNSMLVTPIFDLSGISPVTFGINHRIYSYGSGFTNQILISDDGTNWDVLAEFTEGFTPDEYQYMEFDITPAKAGEQVYLAFAVDYPFLPEYYEVVWEIESITVFEPIPVYDVNFVVEDTDGNLLTDAIVTLDGISNATGDYLFEEIEAGTYNYSVELDGYITATGQVEVVDQDVERTVVLSEPVVITEFPWFEGFDGGALPEGWQNVINEGNGFTFSLGPYSHTYIYYFGDLQRNAMLVTPLLDLSGMETVTLGVYHRIYAYGTGWTNKILISDDGVNWETVAEFTEGFDPDINLYMEFDITPSKAGEQVYLAFEANYPSLPDYYETVWEIVDIDVFEPIEAYNVNFVVEDEESNALNDAVITLNGVTNAAGDYLFEEIEAGTYDYTVELDGYITATGQVLVDQDVEETVVLTQPLIITDFPWFEGFDGGALPDGWQNVVNEGNGFDFALGPYSHTYIYYFGDLQRNAMLVTPLLDLSGMETVTLGVYHRIYAYGTGWTNKILISDDGVNWETVAEFTEGFDPDINLYMEFDITPSKAGEQVYLAFEANYPSLPDYYETVWEIVDIDVFEPIEAYNVNFVVEDEESNALNDAVITLNGVTNAAGDYLFEEIEAGTYDYTVELGGYITETGQVEVVDQDVEETVVLHAGQNIPLVEGWSFISSYLTPQSLDFDQIFADIIQNESMVIMLNKAGIYWPGYNVNTIGQWDSYSGYKIKMNADEMLGIAGTMVENQSVSLTAGADYLPVLSNTPVAFEEILTQISDELVFIYDLSEGLMYWPQGGISTLQLLEPGKAYLLNMNAPAVVSYENLGAEKTLAQNPIMGYPKDIYTKTSEVHLISIPAKALPEGIEAGDYLAVFNEQNQCVGAVRYQGNNETLGLIAYGEDMTDNSNGLIEGENIGLKIIKNETRELIDLMPVWNSAMPNAGLFSQNGQSIVSELKAGALGVADSDTFDFSIYPNPANDNLTIALSGSQTASVNICDQLGQIVWQGQLSQGNTSVNISALSQGIYFVQIDDLKQNRRTLKLIKE